MEQRDHPEGTQRMLGFEDNFAAMSAVVVCCALLAWIASQSRQPILLGYCLAGILLGPSCLNLIQNVDVLEDLSHLGVVLLLFLAGLVLHPDRLHKFFKQAMAVTITIGVTSWILIFSLLKAWGHSIQDCAIAGAALMFSSTILVVKLLPTTTLHQKRLGSLCIAILIAQDLLAVVVILFVGPQADSGLLSTLLLPLKAALLIVAAVLGEQFVIRKMMRKCDRYNEVLVMLCLGWCVGVAFLGYVLGMPHEVGAFIAGVTIARGKIALILSEELKPLRDFFLMFFFFVLGAGMEFAHLGATWLPAVIGALLIVTTRPFICYILFRRFKEDADFSRETALRLGQGSEFAMVIAVAAKLGGNLSENMSQMIQLTAVLTMLISSYVVVEKLPTPIGKPGLQRD